MKQVPRPMLATLVPRPFDEPGWVYEEKYDGNRVLAHRHDGEVKLLSRNLNDVTAAFPEIAGAVRRLPDGGLVLDGEIVVFDAKGVSRFQLLQRRALSDVRARPRFAVFDCLERDGRSLLRAPLVERRRALERVLRQRHGVLMLARRLPRDGMVAYREARRRGWEGIIAKDESAPYEPGRRSTRWRKVKVRKEGEFVIGGFTPPTGKRRHFGGLLLGLYDRARLRYVGRAGTGFSDELLGRIHARLRPLATERSPFEPAPRIGSATWVRPRLVAQVAFGEWTADGYLRQPAFLGLREDKRPAECTWRQRER